MIQTQYTYDDAAHDIQIRESVSLVEEGAIVDLITSSVIRGEEDVLVYAPNFYTYALYANLLKFYTDFEITPDTKIDDLYRLINESDITNVLHSYISATQMESIICAVENKMNYIMDMHKAAVAPKSQFDGLAADLRAILAKWDKKLEKAFKPRLLEKALKNLSEVELNQETFTEAMLTFYQGQKKDNADIS